MLGKKKKRNKKSPQKKAAETRKRHQADHDFGQKFKKEFWTLFLGLVAILSFLALFGAVGKFGEWLDKSWQLIFGWGWFLWPIILFVIIYFILFKIKKEIRPFQWVGLFLTIISIYAILHLAGLKGLTDLTTTPFQMAKDGLGGGVFGFAVGQPIYLLASFWGGLIIYIFIFLISLMLVTRTSLDDLLSKKDTSTNNPANDVEDESDENKNESETEKIEAVGFIKKKLIPNGSKKDNTEQNEADEAEKEQQEMFKEPKKKFRKIDIPLELLNEKGANPTSGNIKKNQDVIQDTLEEFGIDVEMDEVAVGPTVTQYTFKPASGVKVSRITTLNNDLALALAAHPIRIEAPIPGKSLIGIEVPNQKIAMVGLKEILESQEFQTRKNNLYVSLGKDVAGKSWTADISKMPHLLVAGTTGSGKTVCINTIIVSLLYQNQPDDLKFIMVDPKRVEMHQYNNIPHLITPVITDVKKTVNALKWAVKEMERRLEVLSNAKKRNISSYNNENPAEKMPYIVIIIDELADLMMGAGPEVESAIVRLAQMARAVGIHLILATQRPSVNVITGLIKANITSRISFAVASAMDSRTILDTSGAEKLLGRGDMLFINSELSKPKRIQGAYLSDEEIDNVVNYLKENCEEPEYDETITQKKNLSDISAGGTGEISDADLEDSDELLPEAKEMVIKTGKASASYLQRKFRIGYSRAARILDLLEEIGIVGPANGSKPREVIARKEELVADSYLAGEVNNNEEAEEMLEELENEMDGVWDEDSKVGEDNDPNRV